MYGDVKEVKTMDIAKKNNRALANDGIGCMQLFIFGLHLTRSNFSVFETTKRHKILLMMSHPSYLLMP